MNQEPTDPPRTSEATDPALELGRSDADVVLNLIVERRPLRHALGYFFEVGFAQAARLDELRTPDQSATEDDLSVAVAEILALNHTPPGYVRAARRGKLLGFIIGVSWFNTDQGIGRVRDAVLFTAGFAEELSRAQCQFLMMEIEGSGIPSPVGSARWALAYVLHEALVEDES